MGVVVLGHGTRVARKAHICDHCCTIIDVGEQYHSSFYVDRGDPFAFKSHRICESLARMWRENNDWYDEEGLDCDGWHECRDAWQQEIANYLAPGEPVEHDHFRGSAEALALYLAMRGDA